MFKVKLLYPDAQAPTRGTAQSIGLDCYAYLPHRPSGFLLRPCLQALIPLGFAAQTPEGTYGRLAPRSGLALKHGIHVMAGVIDRDYRGEWAAMLYNCREYEGFTIRHGDRVCQIILEQARLDPVEIVDDLDVSARGAGGYGSTGR